jgi:hypothetical protein
VGSYGCNGSPSTAYEAIHAANPPAQVALGGLTNIDSHAWIDQVLATPGTDAIHRFDLANIHVRTRAIQAGPTVARWRHYLARKGFHGPLWVTETGYPADPAWQTQPGYQRGPVSQARWMTTVIPAMLHAGAAMVFVTERDNLTGPYASEGILETPDPLTANPQYTRRPSYYSIRMNIRQQDASATRARRRHEAGRPPSGSPSRGNRDSRCLRRPPTP